MDSVGDYLSRIARYPLLTGDQEISLSKKILKAEKLIKGESQSFNKEEKKTIQIGTKAKEKLVNCNLRLVVHIASKYKKRLRGNSMEFLDLIQEGSIGLQRAAELFDGTRGYKFSTYSFWWIRQAITRAMDHKERAIRIPQNCLEKVYKAVKTAEIFTAKNNREPTIKELSTLTEISIEELTMLLERSKNLASLDQTDEDGKPWSEANFIDHNFCKLETESSIEIMEDALCFLAPRDQALLKKRFGLKGHKCSTYTKLAEESGVSRERVRQKCETAKTRLRLQMLRNSFIPA